MRSFASIRPPKTWFVGDAPALADMMLGPTLAATLEGAELMAGTPLVGYLDRMNARRRKADSAH